MFEGFSDVRERLHHTTREIALDFRNFVFKQNVLSLAIGIIIGTATNQVVGAINADILMPVVNLFFPDQRWRQAGPVLSTYKSATGQIVQNRLGMGDLAFNFANLLVVGFIAYVLTKMLLSSAAPVVPAAPAAPTRGCPFCLETVPEAATRCKFCTSELPPAPPPVPAPPPPMTAAP